MAPQATMEDASAQCSAGLDAEPQATMEDAERAGLDAERAILLFYHYGAVASDELTWQTEQCERLGLKGRLRIAREGLNGTLSGLRTALTEYTALVDARVGAALIDWKFGTADISQCFAELSVREVTEVVSLGVNVPLAEAGTHLDAADFHAALSDGGCVVFPFAGE